MACALVVALTPAAQADIFRWDNGQLIPGTVHGNVVGIPVPEPASAHLALLAAVLAVYLGFRTKELL
jgi:hypothetical protein